MQIHIWEKCGLITSIVGIPTTFAVAGEAVLLQTSLPATSNLPPVGVEVMCFNMAFHKSHIPGKEDGKRVYIRRVHKPLTSAKYA